MCMRLNPLFSNGMVLAAGKPIRVFGEGIGTVTVRFLQFEKTITSAVERWLVELPAQPSGGPYEMQICMDGKWMTLSDIYIGEVILLHGQSNMQFKMRESTYPIQKYEACNRMRLFSIQNFHESESWQPADGWVSCCVEEVGNWSAIGYHVGLRIAKEKQCAVGLIACYEGASVIESWLPEGTVEDMGLLFERNQLHGDHFNPRFVKWNGHGTLYHYMVEPLMPFALSHVIWYQGESNASDAEGAVYDRILTRLIEQRRRDFADGNLSFVVVQLADTLERMNKSIGWRLVQEAQARVGNTVPFVTTVISCDVCETNDIHPPTKDKLAARIANVIVKEIV